MPGDDKMLIEAHSIVSIAYAYILSLKTRLSALPLSRNSTQPVIASRRPSGSQLNSLKVLEKLFVIKRHWARNPGLRSGAHRGPTPLPGNLH